jgi:acyl carrier protein
MRERIKRVLKDTLDLDDVPDNISQKNCAKWDSMHHLQLVVSLETEFNISFEPEDIGSMKSLVEVEDKVKLLLSKDF